MPCCDIFLLILIIGAPSMKNDIYSFNQWPYALILLGIPVKTSINALDVAKYPRDFASNSNQALCL